MSKEKVIILDGGFYCHKAIFAYSSAYKKEVYNKCQYLHDNFNTDICKVYDNVNNKSSSKIKITVVFEWCLNNLDLIEEKGHPEIVEKIFQGKTTVDKLVQDCHLWISPSSYTYFQMMISDLKKIGVNKDDIIIVALDGRNSWRKAFLPEYKANRKALRAKQKNIISWTDEYEKISQINHDLNCSTNWNFIEFNLIFSFEELYFTDEGQKYNINQHHDLFIEKSNFSIEADDIQAFAVRYFSDKEVILVTIDEDLDQLIYFKNCKIFNPNTKSITNKSVRGFYNIVESPLDIIKKKVKSGDASDNILVSKKTDTSYDMEIRQLIIKLLSLPKWIEKEIEEIFETLDYNKEISHDSLPFKNSLGKRYDTIYEGNGIRTFEQSIKRYNDYLKKEDEKRIDTNRKNREKSKQKREKSLR